MPNLDSLVNAIGNEIGVGGAYALTGRAAGKPSLREVMVDMAIDLAAMNVAGAFGLTLEHLATDIPDEWGDAGSHVIPGGGSVFPLLREMLARIAADLAAIKVAGTIGWIVKHTATKIPSDFLSGGRHLIPNRDDFPGSGTHYVWIGEPLYLAAWDIYKLNDVGGLGVTLLTQVTEKIP